MNQLYKAIILFSSFLSIIISIFINRQDHPIISLLPATYLLLCLVSKEYLNKTLMYKSLFIINLIIYIRYVLIPLLYALDSELIFRNIPNLSIINTAIFIMIYELIITIIVINLLTKNKRITTKNIEIKSNLVGYGFLIFTLLLIILQPKLLTRYSFILTTDVLKSKTIEGLDSSISLLLVQLAHYILIASCIHFTYKYFSKKSRIIGLLLGICMSIFFSMFIVGTSRSSVILPLITSLLLLGDLYSEYKKRLYTFSLGIIIFIILLTTKLKSETINNEGIINTVNNIHYQLQVYFSGVMNVAYAIDSRNFYESFQLNSIISDLVRSIAYFGAKFTSQISALEAFNIRIYNGGLSRDHILPMIGQGYLYFGFILSPIFIIITIILAIKLEKFYARSTSVIMKFIILLFVIRVSLYQMMNMTILISFMTNIYFPLLVISLLNLIFGRKMKIEDR